MDSANGQTADGTAVSTRSETTYVTDPERCSEFVDDATAFVRTMVDRAGADGVVVGLSGGIDSTLTAILALEALGSDAVVGVSMPANKLDRPDATDARTIAEGLGIEFHEVSLRPLLDTFEGSVTGDFDVEADEYVLGNVAARLRMTCLYCLANARSLLVAGTANRSELLTGYFTKYGDGGADCYPLGGLYKTEVRAVAQHVGVPRRIVSKASTAGFWAGQTDAAELGATYPIVDALLRLIVDQGRRPAAAIEAVDVDRETGEALLESWATSGHKRRTPPVLRVGARPPSGTTAVRRTVDRFESPDRRSG